MKEERQEAGAPAKVGGTQTKLYILDNLKRFGYCLCLFVDFTVLEVSFREKRPIVSTVDRRSSDDGPGGLRRRDPHDLSLIHISDPTSPY